MGLYQHIVRHILSPLDHARAGDIDQLRYLREFEKSQFLSAAELRELQLQRVTRLLQHAYQNCRFYQRRFDELGMLPSDITSLRDLGTLPILEKGDIQQNRDDILARNWPKDDLILNQTGGSTGEPISFFLSNDRRRSRAAATIRHNRWAGWEIGDRVAVVWGASHDIRERHLKQRLRNLLMDRALYLDTAHITERDLLRYHRALLRFRPKIMLGYAKSAVLFAKYLQVNNLEPYPLHSIVTSAEVLEPSERVLLENVFGCRVFNRYGCREVSVVASECDRHDGLHTMAEGLHIEVARASISSSETPQLGAVLVTDLLNFAMPLIRYRIGDVAALDGRPCPCGRGLPKLVNLQGRITDFLVGSEGQLVSGVYLTTYVIAERPRLGRIQLLQEERGRILCRIESREPAKRLKADLAFVESETKKHLGRHTKVAFELVAEFPETESGKFLFCRSTVACDFLGTQHVAS